MNTDQLDGQAGDKGAAKIPDDSLALVHAAALAMGLTADQADQLVVGVGTIDPADPSPSDRICGNTHKASHLVCRQAPHPDIPGNRTPHTAARPDGRAITWTSGLTVGELLTGERADVASGKVKRCAEKLGQGGPKCERAEHGLDREHAAANPDAGKPDASALITWAWAPVAAGK